jgi:hypothetical protein
MSHTTRRVRRQRNPVTIPCPWVLRAYNMVMGHVDYFNREAQEQYRGAMRTNRLWKHIFFTLWHFSVYVAFALRQIAYYTIRDEEGNFAYKKLGPSPNKEFRLLLAEELCKEQREHTTRRRRFRNRRLSWLPHGHATVEEVVSHTAVKVKNMPKSVFRGRSAECAYCRIKIPPTLRGRARKHAKRTGTCCVECKVGLHLGKCFVLYHSDVVFNLKDRVESVSQLGSSTSNSDSD